MPNQNPNGRNATRDDNRPSWRQQDMIEDDREHMMRGGRSRDWQEDNRSMDRSSTERYGGGQSGYGAGREGDDRSMGAGYRNQSTWNRSFDDRQGMHTDDRFTGRGGSQYWDERGERGYQQRTMDDRFERTGYNSGYQQGAVGYGGYGQQPTQHPHSPQSFRGGGNAGAQQYADDYNQNYGQGHQRERQGGPQGYYGQGGVGGYNMQGYGTQRGDGMQRGDQRDFDMQRDYGMQAPMQGGYSGSRMQGGYGPQGPSHRGKGPMGYTRSDDRIKEQVCEALSDDDHIDASHIEVVVKNGEVILTGHVEDRRQKRLAEDLVERMPGVKDVQNQLRCGTSERRGNPNNGSAVGRNETEMSSSDKKHRA